MDRLRTQWNAPTAETNMKFPLISELPAGWSARLDPKSGDTYYFNLELLTSQWNAPKAKTSLDRPRSSNVFHRMLEEMLGSVSNARLILGTIMRGLMQRAARSQIKEKADPGLNQAESGR